MGLPHHVSAKHRHMSMTERAAQFSPFAALNGYEDAVSEIANTAIRLKTGARGLRTIIENLMTDVMYDIPSNDSIEEVKITRDCVLGKSKPAIVKKSA